MKVERQVMVLLMLILMACQKSEDVAVLEAGLFEGASIQVDGLTRIYDYYIPKPGGASSLPVVFLLHGGGSSSQDLTGESGLKAPYKVWMELADLDQFMIIYPNGTLGSHGGQGWNDCRSDAASNPQVDDVRFIESLIMELARSFPIDNERIYATGTSNGGHMSL
ncbi:MAG: hypothetical protein HKN87_22470, partial [Saprospiraceae bacterium]|nr:hypothetical protein [Saprospiraceae bacterium]